MTIDVTVELITLCPGGDCPLKINCTRYNGGTDKAKYFYWPPYNKRKKACEFFIDDKRPKDGSYAD